jgi:hypothetical protein
MTLCPRLFLVAAWLLFVCACPVRTHPIEDAGLPQGAAVDAGVPDAGPAELAFNVHVAFADGGEGELPVEPGSRPAIDPPVSLELNASAVLRNYRVRLFDEGDRVVPSDDQAEQADGGTRYRIRFVDPLKPGRRYALVIDAQSGQAFSDAFGREHPDVRVGFVTSGERERPVKSGTRRRRH